MARKSTPKYRPATSRNPVALSRFREQMADYARAEYLRELRDGRHLSRERVANEIGVTTKTLYSWENGGSIRWDNAKKLGGFYGVDPEALVSREPVEHDELPGTQMDRIEAKVDHLIASLAPVAAGEALLGLPDRLELPSDVGHPPKEEAA